MHERIRDKILETWGRLVASHPVITLTVCVALAVGSIYLTVTRLEFRSDRSTLISEDQVWNRLYLEYQRNFPRNNDVYVVIDGEPGDEAINDLARQIAVRLDADPQIGGADAGFDVATLDPRMFLISSPEQFWPRLADLGRARRLTAADNVNAALGLLLSELGGNGQDPAALDQLDSMLAPFLAAAHGDDPDFAFMSPVQARWQPLASQDGAGRLRLVRVSLREESNGVNQIGTMLPWLRETVTQKIADSAVPDVDWGVTGIAAIEADETTEAIHDSTIASILAISLITLVMFLAFRGLRVPLLAALSLLLGMAWSFGWLMISVGHLQLLSVVFSVILLGLGIDSALLFVSRLELVQGEHKSLVSATSRVYRRMGPGMVTGAVTTAAAFAAIAFTDFQGMAEMGTIAAGGILLCLIAVLSAFPAMLALTGRWKQIIRHRPGGETAHFANGRLDAVDGHPVITLVCAGVVVLTLAGLSLFVRYDPNVLNLQSVGVESVVWEKRLVDEDARTAWAGVVVAQPEKAEDLVQRIRSSPNVSEVGGMGQLFPVDLDERLEAVTRLRNKAVFAPDAAPGMDTLVNQLSAVRAGISLRLAGLPEEIRDRLVKVNNRIRDATVAARALDRNEQAASWQRLDEGFRAARDELAAWLDLALTSGPPTAAMLPPFLRDLWIGADGTWLLLAYPQADELGRSILDPARLGPFIESIRIGLAGSGATVIGPPVQIYESSRLIKREYIKAACYALAAILLLLCLDFGRLGDALCAMAPVAIGFVGAFGLMGATNVPLNFANIIVLPIIFGIGVNAGVHVVHRWRAEPYGRPAGLSGATGRGITLTMITTMIGFGCLLTARHRGVQSLGFVMLMGLGVTLLACYTVLPAILRLRTPHARTAAPLPGQTTIKDVMDVGSATET